MVKEGCEDELRHELLQSGMCALLPPDRALRDSSGQLVTGGVFAVPHKPTSDRVINDRRPFNSFERQLGWAKLPHGP